MTARRKTYFESVRDFWFGGGDKRAAPGTGILTLAIENDSAELFSCNNRIIGRVEGWALWG